MNYRVSETQFWKSIYIAHTITLENIEKKMVAIENMKKKSKLHEQKYELLKIRKRHHQMRLKIVGELI